MFSFSKPKSKRSSRKFTAPRTCLGVETLESRLVPYSVSGNAWPHPKLVTISFVPDGTIVGSNSQGYITSNLFASMNAKFGSPAVWQNQVLKAAQVWAKYTNLNFTLVPDYGAAIGNGSYQQGSPSFGDIRIGGYNFGTTTLAQAYLPPPVNNYSIAGDFQFNTGRNWTLGQPGVNYDLFTVAMHEFGHALGLYHSGVVTAAMYGNWSGAKTGLAGDDVNGIRAAYSPGLGRTNDPYDLAISNGSFSNASEISALIDPLRLTALVSDLDISSSLDVDYYEFIVPAGTNGSMTVELQSSGLSQLEPYLMLYNASQTAIAYTDTTGTYGTTLTATIPGVTAGETYFIRVGGDDSSSPFGTGAYALTLGFGDDPLPTVPLPDTLTANGNPLKAGGGQATETSDEMRVNTATANSQTLYHESWSPNAVAMDANGNYVVTWVSSGQDGGGLGVYAQRYNAAGVAQGPEFRVNTTTASDQAFANVAMDADGDFVIVWASWDQDAGDDDWGVYGRRYNAAGVALGGEFQINTTTASHQKFPTVAMAPNGSFVVTWSSGSTLDVMARRYDANGVAQGNEFRVNTYTSNTQQHSTAAMDAAGNFVITWSSSGQDGSGYGVYAQRYNAAGVAQGGEFRVNTTTASDQKHSTVAMDAAGNFVITWSSSGQDGSGYGIYARRYNPAGTVLGGEFRVSTTTANDQIWSSVAMDSNGNFMVTWSDKAIDGNLYGVYAQQYNAAGAALGTEFRVSTTTTGDQRYSSLAMDAHGHAVVVWSGNGVGDSSGVFSQLYLVNSGSGLANMEAGPHGYWEGGGDHDHHHGRHHHSGDDCACAACTTAVDRQQGRALALRRSTHNPASHGEDTHSTAAGPWTLLSSNQLAVDIIAALSARDNESTPGGEEWLTATDACFAQEAWRA